MKQFRFLLLAMALLQSVSFGQTTDHWYDETQYAALLLQGDKLESRGNPTGDFPTASGVSLYRCEIKWSETYGKYDTARTATLKLLDRKSYINELESIYNSSILWGVTGTNEADLDIAVPTSTLEDDYYQSMGDSNTNTAQYDALVWWFDNKVGPAIADVEASKNDLSSWPNSRSNGELVLAQTNADERLEELESVLDTWETGLTNFMAAAHHTSIDAFYDSLFVPVGTPIAWAPFDTKMLALESYRANILDVEMPEWSVPLGAEWPED